VPTRRLAFGLIAPVALLVLVAALATLQYRWVGQVSEAERAQLRESLDRRVQELAEEFDRELGRAFRIFQPVDEMTPADAAPFARRHDEWLRSARFPAILKTAWYARATSAAPELYQYVPERRAFDPADWPAALEPVRTRLTHRIPMLNMPPAASATLFVASASPALPEVPALLVPVPKRSAEARLPGFTGRAGMMVAIHLDGDQIVLELDRSYLQDAVLPALVSRHFPDSDRYRIAIVDGRQYPLLTRGMSAGTGIDPARADAAARFFTLRVEALRETVSLRMTETVRAAGVAGAIESGRGYSTSTVRRPAQTPNPADNKLSFLFEQRSGAADRVAMAASSWQVLVQHEAGSLDAAVANVRRRNLWLSFGILAVLAAGVGLIVVNARRSERLAAQQMDFVATVSHELRTPLAVIRSAAQNLSAGVVREPAQATRYGELIETEGRRLTDMVEQVLEYAGLSGNRRPRAAAPVDVGALVRGVVASCQALLDAERFEVEVDVASDLRPALADEGALRRALQNLIGNAMKYAADGRWLRVSAQDGGGRPGSEVRIAVSDRGRGIAAEDLPHIFEPFYRGRYALERQIHGNGLGLSLVKRIADAHGGRVTVRSAPGEGTTFTLHVPAAPASAAVPALSEPAADAGGPHG
jgi:signal transduction histidine kinase